MQFATVCRQEQRSIWGGLNGVVILCCRVRVFSRGDKSNDSVLAISWSSSGRPAHCAASELKVSNRSQVEVLYAS